MLLSPDWRPPDDALTSWMQGTSHRTPSQVWTNSYYARRRRQAFYDACRNCDPQLAIWPEFDQNLRRLRLTKWYQKGTISTEVAGLLILEDNRSFSPWMARAGWLARRGKDPLVRRRHNRVMRHFYEDLVPQARRMAERRQFEATAIRAISLA